MVRERKRERERTDLKGIEDSEGPRIERSEDQEER